MSQINITDFPEEIIEKIFSDLNNTGGSLKPLTEVCKRFNHVICSLTKFMSKFTAIWYCKTASVETLFVSTRKYQQIKIVNSIDVMSDELMQFLKMQKQSLISLIVSSCEIRILELMKIFDEVKNIRHFYIYNSCIHGDQLPKAVNLQMLKKVSLVNIKGDGVIYFLNLLEGGKNVQDFEFHNDCGLNNKLFHLELSKTLSKFTKLKRFINYSFMNPVFQDGWLDGKITYQLEELSLVFDDLFGAVFNSNLSFYDKFVTFVNNHHHSLKKLDLGGFLITNEIIKYVFSIDQLTELTLRHCKFDSEPRTNKMNYSIKKLNFVNKLINSITADVSFMLSNCKRVQEVSFSSMNITKEVSMILAGQMNIEKLNFFCCDIIPMTYPSVKFIKLEGIRDYFNDMIKVMRVNRHLKYLLLPAQIQTYHRFKTAMKTLKPHNLHFYHVPDFC